MKKQLFSLMAVIIAASTLYGCSKPKEEISQNEEKPVVEDVTEVENTDTNETTEEDIELNKTQSIIAEIAANEDAIIFPMIIEEQLAKDMYHIESDAIEEYGIVMTGRSPGIGFVMLVKASEGQIEEAKTIVETVLEERVGNAFYPDEVEAAQAAEVITEGDYVGLFILNEDVKEDVINFVKEAIK